ncbi:MAG: hypothetical protein ACFE95_11480 [Candidatus Hodarchaeota archaeon]
MSNLEVELEIVLPQVTVTTSGLPVQQKFMNLGNIRALFLEFNPNTFDSGRSTTIGDSKP